MSETVTLNQPSIKQTHRLPFIDWLRGVSILLMVIYHFCYDLDLFGYIVTTFGKGPWIPFRYVIVIGFLTLVGVSLVIVHQRRVNWKSLNKRTLQLFIACIFVSGSGYFIAANKITIFGILQFILVASWLALPIINKPKLALIVGIAIFIIGHSVTFPVFNSIWLHWIGMAETKRAALDFVPLFPWLGAVFVGVFLGHWFMSEKGRKLGAFTFNNHPNAVLRKINQTIEKMGQNSLVIYLVHQPIMFGVFYAIEYLH